MIGNDSNTSKFYIVAHQPRGSTLYATEKFIGERLWSRKKEDLTSLTQEDVLSRMEMLDSDFDVEVWEI